MWSRYGAVDLDGEFRPNANPQLGSDFTDRFPTRGGIRTEPVSLQKCNFFVAEIRQMSEREACGELVVQNNICDAVNARVP